MLGPELVSLGKRGGRGATLTLEVHMSHPVVCDVKWHAETRSVTCIWYMYIIYISISTVYMYLSLSRYLYIYIYISAYVHIYRLYWLYFLQTCHIPQIHHPAERKQSLWYFWGAEGRTLQLSHQHCPAARLSPHVESPSLPMSGWGWSLGRDMSVQAHSMLGVAVERLGAPRNRDMDMWRATKLGINFIAPRVGSSK